MYLDSIYAPLPYVGPTNESPCAIVNVEIPLNEVDRVTLTLLRFIKAVTTAQRPVHHGTRLQVVASYLDPARLDLGNTMQSCGNTQVTDD